MLRRPIALLATLSLAAACSSDKEARASDEIPDEEKPDAVVERTLDDGTIEQIYDADRDGRPELIKSFTTVEDPANKEQTLRLLMGMRIDVNQDGTFDIQRTYTPSGGLESERADVDLDGSPDVILSFDDGVIVKKTILADGGEAVESTRFYAEGVILRVERDLDGDGSTDYWEYYEEGDLNRIGRDYNNDGRADAWTTRR